MSVSVDVGVMWRLSEDFNRRFGLRMQPAPTATTHHPHPHHHAHHAHHHTAVHHYHHQHHHPHGPTAVAAAAAAASHSSMIFNGKDDKANGISGQGQTKRDQMRNKNRNVEANSKLRIPLSALMCLARSVLLRMSHLGLCCFRDSSKGFSQLAQP